MFGKAGSGFLVTRERSIVMTADITSKRDIQDLSQIWLYFRINKTHVPIEYLFQELTLTQKC